jgi:hypothetical protein
MQLAARVVELGARVGKPEKFEAAQARLDAEPEEGALPEVVLQAELDLEQLEDEVGGHKAPWSDDVGGP